MAQRPAGDTTQPRGRRAPAKTGRRHTDAVPAEAWELLLKRFDMQDKALTEHRDELRDSIDGVRTELSQVRGELSEVRVQTTRTNGRVTAIEDRNDDQERRSVRRGDRHRAWIVCAVGAAATLAGGLLSAGLGVHF